jgi:hypothetical protein
MALRWIVRSACLGRHVVLERLNTGLQEHLCQWLTNHAVTHPHCELGAMRPAMRPTLCVQDRPTHFVHSSCAVLHCLSCWSRAQWSSERLALYELKYDGGDLAQCENLIVGHFEGQCRVSVGRWAFIGSVFFAVVLMALVAQVWYALTGKPVRPAGHLFMSINRPHAILKHVLSIIYALC